ncbi:NADPH:quinone reductase-like Zn-dependent oxidoreductase [Collimonas sp. PA-H2]|nr:NADPH:quinone reductase-like Zn-dependent oxidoreductase [Collimonas sp. PA-H2]
MKALRFREYGSLDNVRMLACELRRPGPHEVRVRIEFAGANPLDLKLLSGQMATIFPLDFAYTVGTDISGVVEATGELVQRFKCGDRVFGRLDARVGGAFAEYAIAPEHGLCPIPEAVDFKSAAALPTAAGTAWLALFDIGCLRVKQKILIHAASGGVGSFAVQLAKLAGAYVIATASLENHELIKNLGADEVIDYKKDDFTQHVTDVDLVLDPIGGETQERSWSVIKPDGVLVSLIDRVIGNRGDIRGKIRGAFAPLANNSATLHGIALLVASGQLKVVVDRVYRFEQAGSALEHVASGHSVGKVLVHVAG